MTSYRKSMKEALAEVRLDEAKMKPAQVAALKKAYEPMRDKKISMANADKLNKMMTTVGKDKDTLIQLFKADIPFISQSAMTQLIITHNMSGAEINKLREEFNVESVELDEGKVTKKERDRLEDENQHGELALKLAQAYGTPEEVKKIKEINKRHEKRGSIERKDQQERDKISNKYYKMAEEVELDEAKYDLYHKDFSTAMQHAYKMAKKLHGITVDPKEIDDKVASGPRKPSEGKTNSYRLKGDKGAIQVQVYNKGGSKPFELNMYQEEVELDEGKMKELHGYISQGKSAEEIAKKMKLDVDTIKALMAGYHEAKRDVDPADVDTSATDDDVKAADKNIMMQLRKSVSLRGKFDVEFLDKKKEKVDQKIAQAVLDKFNKMKKPSDKEKFQAKVAKSHKDLLNALKEETVMTKYLKTKKDSLEESILGVWALAAEEMESIKENPDGRTKVYKNHREKLEAARLRRENQKKNVNEDNIEEFTLEEIDLYELDDEMFEVQLKKKSVGDRLKAKKKREKWKKTSAGKKSELKSKKRADKVKKGTVKVDKKRSKAAKKTAKLYSGDNFEEGSKEEYQKFFNKALKKFGVKSPSELEGDKEKEFYDYVDKNWKADHEESVKKESYEIGTPEYRKHTQEITPNEEANDYIKSANFKVQSMREAMRKVWGLDEKKSVKKEEDKDVVKGNKTLTGGKVAKVEVNPKIKD